MEQIKNSTLIIGLVILTCFLISCKTDININHYIDKNIPFKLTITNTDISTGLTKQDNFEIAVNSVEYKKLMAWCDTNVNGWTQTFASYIPDIFVRQGNFRLLTIAKGTSVVVGFTDDNNKPRQYTKTIKKEELDFLSK
jgi:hypothetical protein